MRPQDEDWWTLFDLLVQEADLLGKRVIDVGCGTGRWSEALAERGSRVWGVDPSAEMVAEARKRGVNAKVARAETLPFKEGWFDRALLVLVIHVLDRPAVFRELRRVLADDGRIAIGTFDHAQFAGHYLNPYFPSLAEIDRARFPTREQLEGELRAAGYEPRTIPLHQRAVRSREWVLERIRGRFISTLQLLGEDEFAEGLARAERELPAEVEAEQHLLAVVADVVRPPL
ncbi:MAG TPA: class I SAM-dependent methyltransferase [Gaiellaceae bacterium]